MTNVLAILVLSSGFSAAVEVGGSFIEQSFANTPAGVQAFLEWSEPLIVTEGKSVKICTVTLATDAGPVMQWLLEKNMGPALLSPVVYREHAERSGAPLDSASTAAQACLAAFPFIRRAQ